MIKVQVSGKECIDDLAFRLIVIMVLFGKVRVFNRVPSIKKFKNSANVRKLNIWCMLRPVRAARHEQEWPRCGERGNFGIISVVRLTFVNR